jgi:hypothetical protein
MTRDEIQAKYDEFFGNGLWERAYKRHIVVFVEQCLMAQKQRQNVMPPMNLKEKICLQVGMKVKVKNDTKQYGIDAGKIKTITKQLPDFLGLEAFALDNDEGTWLIDDFDFCVDSPDSII